MENIFKAENKRENKAQKHLGTYRTIDFIQVVLNKMKMEKFIFKPLWLLSFYLSKLRANSIKIN